mmetsp:Transcript_23156/g.64934  ORF Transcript_23156/g.64934 Transcript_23156/m.64934 type:complete len:82 (+) Transcript_23156:3131-3376(+)
MWHLATLLLHRKSWICFVMPLVMPGENASGNLRQRVLAPSLWLHFTLSQVRFRPHLWRFSHTRHWDVHAMRLLLLTTQIAS